MLNEYKQTYNQFLSLSNLCQKTYSDSRAELKASLKRTRDFLDFLGAPDKHLKIIHIAGTSGKGSVAYTLHQMLAADGQIVGTYLSPHTTTFLERFQFNNSLLDAKQLTSSMKDLMKSYEAFLKTFQTPLSFFELSTCLAFLTFRQAEAKWCVLETGCGGRWDATNVIYNPEVAIITNIDKDHTELLGSSLAQIAYEKAGIIKKNATVFCGEVRPKIKKVFMDEAIKNNAALFFIHPPFENIVDSDHGEHQQHNISLAIAAAKEINLSHSAIEHVLKQFKRLPCRFETIQTNPLVILDGAHSPAKIASTVKKMKEIKKPIHLIFGCAANKDIKQMMDQLVDHVATVTTTRFQMEQRKAAVPSDLLSMVPKAKQLGAYLDHQEAFSAVVKHTKKNEAILITGSLFLSGEMRARWISEEEIIMNHSSFKS